MRDVIIAGNTIAILPANDPTAKIQTANILGAHNLTMLCSFPHLHAIRQSLVRNIFLIAITPINPYNKGIFIASKIGDTILSQRCMDVSMCNATVILAAAETSLVVNVLWVNFLFFHKLYM